MENIVGCRQRNVMDDIRDLTNKELIHDYPREIAKIEDALCCEKAKIAESYELRIKQLEKKNEMLEISNMAMATYIKEHDL